MWKALREILKLPLWKIVNLYLLWFFCRYVQYFPSLHLIKKCTFHSIIANRGDDESKYSTVQKLLFQSIHKPCCWKANRWIGGLRKTCKSTKRFQSSEILNDIANPHVVNIGMMERIDIGGWLWVYHWVDGKTSHRYLHTINKPILRLHRRSNDSHFLSKHSQCISCALKENMSEIVPLKKSVLHKIFPRNKASQKIAQNGL